MLFSFFPPSKIILPPFLIDDESSRITTSLALVVKPELTSTVFALNFLPFALTSDTPVLTVIKFAVISALLLVIAAFKLTVPLPASVFEITLLFADISKFKVPSLVIPSVTVNILEFTFKVLFSSILTAF